MLAITTNAGPVDVAKLVAAAKAPAPAQTAGAPTAEIPTPEGAPGKPADVTAPVLSIPKPAKPPEPAAPPLVAATAPPTAEPPREWRVGPHGLPVFAVQLHDNPELYVEAEDRLDAIERYNVACGILGTIHKHDVRRV